MSRQYERKYRTAPLVAVDQPDWASLVKCLIAAGYPKSQIAKAAELESVGKEQLKLAAQMSVMLGNQLRLAQRSRELNAALSKLVRNFSNE